MTSARPKARSALVERLWVGAAVSVALGVMLAALAFPVVGGLGLAVKSGADDFLALPADLSAGPPAQRSKILASDGSLLATLYLQNRVNVSLKQVPLQARQAVIAIEDSRFYAHKGLDYKGIARAALTNAGAGGVKQGASTLTQQYVKNALIESATDKKGQQAARADSLERKLQEARYAMALEQRMSKDQILERYLNIAYFGRGVYGIGTAANFYFAKPVNALTLAESALLAGMVQNPNRFDPSSKDPDVLAQAAARRDLVLGRMSDLGFITEDDRANAAGTKIVTKLRPVVSGCENPAVRSPFFCDYIRRELEDTAVGAVLGRTKAERQRNLLGGGLTIRTSLDPIVQTAAQTSVDERVPRKDPFGAAAAMAVVQPGTGLIRAMAVDRTYSDEKGPDKTKVNYATGGTFGFQAGSTFKAFVLAEALRQGIPLSLTLFSPQRYTSKVFKDVKDGEIEPYSIQNAGDSEQGTFDMQRATSMSVNTYFLQLEERTGIEKPVALAEQLGLKAINNYALKPLDRFPSFVLGTAGVSPLAMAGAYASFGAHGLYCPPRGVTAIIGPDGKPLALPENRCEQVLEPGVADTLTSLLRQVIDGPDPYRTGLRASLGRPAAGKTGTVNESKAAWFVGYTPQLAGAVWVGKPTPTPMKRVTINGRYYRQVYGGDIPAAIWRQAMAQAHENLPVEQFGDPDPEVVDGEQVEVPDVTGQPYDVAKQALADAGFGVRDGGFVAAAPTAYGIVPYTSPRAGRSVSVGRVITVFQSNGKVAPPPPPPSPSPSPSQAAPPASTPPPPAPTPKPGKTRG